MQLAFATQVVAIRDIYHLPRAVINNVYTAYELTAPSNYSFQSSIFRGTLAGLISYCYFKSNISHI